MATPTRHSPHFGTPALEWLDHHPEGARMLQTARELLTVQAVLAQGLPPALARHARVARMDGQQLVVMVPGPAHAARLRQLTAGATTRLQAAGWRIDRIIVRIDAGMSRAGTQKPRRETRPLDEQALQSFERLEKQLTPGPLADAVGRLLRHHRS